MKTLYESTFVSIGTLACEALKDNFIITFGEVAPQDVAEYCFIHRTDISDCGDFVAGSVMTLGDYLYPVTAVGSVALRNLRDLGHITICFDGAGRAGLPGAIHVAGSPPSSIAIGQKFRLAC